MTFNDTGGKSQKVRLSWALFGLSDSDVLFAQREIDAIFSDYSFYPQIEWKEHDVYPPDNYGVYGAWRNDEGNTFVFLLDYTLSGTIADESNQLWISFLGVPSELDIIRPQIAALKEYFAVQEDFSRQDHEAGRRLGRVQRSKALTYLTTILGVYTAGVNAFALYLRQINPLESWGNSFVNIWNLAIVIVHLLALFLLVLFILILTAFLFRYGVLLVRRV